MRWITRIVLAAALAAGILLAGVTASRADGWHGERGHWHGGRSGWHGGYWGHWRGGTWGGPGFVIGVGPVGFGSGFWWGRPYAYPYPYPYPYSGRSTVIVQQPPVYIERPAPPAYWYYCPSARGYYPTVPSCPEPWVKVPPRPE